MAATFSEDLGELRELRLDGIGVPGELFMVFPAARVSGLDSAPRLPLPSGVESALDGVPVPSDPGHQRGVESDVEGPAPISVTAGRIRRSSVTATDLARSTFDRIHRNDGVIRAWALLDEDGALQAASDLDGELHKGIWRGPLHGIPVGVKDIVDVAGMRTGAGSRQWSDPGRERIPAADAGIVALLRNAGAVVVGKTTTHEFAFGGTTPPTLNPHDLGRIPGGSSGGSAASVAAGHVRLAVGTDTCGSVRIPASYCGVVGVVPTPGRLPRTGIAPLAWSLDRVGLITRTVDDAIWASLALGVTERMPSSPAEALDSLKGRRIGVPRDVLTPPVDGAVAERFEVALRQLSAAGAKVVPIDITYGRAAVTAGLAILLVEALDFHRDRWAKSRHLFGSDVQGMLEMAEQVTATDYVRAQRVRMGVRSELLSQLAGLDVLLTPTMPCVAPLVAEARDGRLLISEQRVSVADAHLRYNVAANLAGLPAATQPLGRHGGEMPLGLHWVAAPEADEMILRAMSAYDALSATGVPRQPGE